MAQPAKFLFDNDFGRGTTLSRASVSQHQSEVAEAEARGYRNGLAAGRAEGERVLSAGLTAVGAALDKTARELKQIEARLESEAVEVALAVAEKLAAELIQREPLAEMSALAADCFRHLVGTPRVVIRIGPQGFEEARARLEEIASASGFGGRLVIEADERLGLGDCRIVWGDGSAERDRARVSQAIAAAVESYLAIRPTHNALSGGSR